MNATLVDFGALLSQIKNGNSAPTIASASAFIAAIRAAGKRKNDNGVLVSGTRDEVVADEREAIRAFMGAYAMGQAHGMQLDEARRIASQLLRPVPARETPVSRGSAAPTVAGYVKGMPQPLETIKRDARARLDIAIENRDEKEIRKLQGSLYNR